MNAQAAADTNATELVNYDLAPEVIVEGVTFEKRAARCPRGHALDGL